MKIQDIWLIALATVLSFLVAALAGKPVIAALQKLHFGQTIRDEGPAWHRSKQGTPTMGGLLFIGGTVIALIVAVAVACAAGFSVFGTPAATVSLFAGAVLALLCGAIGFIDDFIKVVKKRNLGLTARQKLLLQLLASAAYAVMMYLFGNSAVYVPFVGEVEFGLWYIPFCVFVVIAMSNATNLTDGVDGLCGTVSVIVTGFFLIFTASAMRFLGLSLYAAAFAGGLCGFLLWNLHPAKVFMGDTGSLFIGAAICAFAFGVGHPFLLVPTGIIYIAENLSVILQVGYFKLTHGKRLFKMSPLHHHFELCGWKETTIVAVFSAVTLIGCVGAFLFWRLCE